MNLLSKTQTVLDRDGDTATHVRFAYAVALAAGEAPTHTVTIEPGDRLNN